MRSIRKFCCHRLYFGYLCDNMHVCIWYDGEGDRKRYFISKRIWCVQSACDTSFCNFVVILVLRFCVEVVNVPFGLVTLMCDIFGVKVSYIAHYLSLETYLIWVENSVPFSQFMYISCPLNLSTERV